MSKETNNKDLWKWKESYKRDLNPTENMCDMNHSYLCPRVTWLMHVLTWHDAIIRATHATEEVIPHLFISNFTQCWIKFTCVLSHFTSMKTTCHTYERVIFHVWMRNAQSYICLYVRMYVPTYVSKYVRINICMHINMYACMYAMCLCRYVIDGMYECMSYMYVCMYVCMSYIYICMYVCMYACMFVCMYVCMCVWMYVWMHHAQSYVHTYIHINVCICIYTQSHKHVILADCTTWDETITYI